MTVQYSVDRENIFHCDQNYNEPNPDLFKGDGS